MAKKEKKIDDRLISEKSTAFSGLTPYTYPATVTAVHDGDTITADIDLGFDVVLRDQKIRLYGINSPELKIRVAGKEVPNKPGLESKTNLEKLIGPLPAKVVIESYRDRKEKYGRYLATVWSSVNLKDGLACNCNEAQLSRGFAKPMKF